MLSKSPLAATPSRWLRVALIANIAAQGGIIITGALVRLTGSGLGCPTWPECAPGSIVPQANQVEGFHKFIEFGNRTLTGLVGLIALLSLIAVWRYHKRRPLGRGLSLSLAVIPVIGTLVQALLGGVTVLTGLNPLTVNAHFLVSIFLVAITCLLYVRFFVNGFTPPRLVSWGMNATFLIGLVVIVTGSVVTGSGPHAGDESSARYPFDVRTTAWLHADSVFLFLGLLVATLAAAVLLVGAKQPWVQKSLVTVLVIALLQGVVGYTQWFTDLPWALVGVHVTLAVMLWISLVIAWARTKPSLLLSTR